MKRAIFFILALCVVFSLAIDKAAATTSHNDGAREALKYVDDSSKIGAKAVYLNSRAPTYGTVTIRYNANGGRRAPNSHSVKKDRYGIVRFNLSSAKPTRDGYIFQGWRLENNSSNALANPGQSIRISLRNPRNNATLTYYAQWKRIDIPDGTVTIRYNANGGRVAPNSHTVKKDRNGVARFNLSSAQPTRDGYIFQGWRLDNNTANAIARPRQSIRIRFANRRNNETLTYYAQWRAERPDPNHKVTIRYNANGGRGAPRSHTETTDRNGIARFNLSSAQPTRNGYTFLGWRLENSSAYAIDSPGQRITIDLGRSARNSTLTYYAQWKTGPGPGEVTIRYNANGGSGAPNSHTVTKDRNGIARFNLSSATPRRKGYDFLGWRLENSSAYAIDTPGQRITIDLGRNSGNTTLTYYAQWRADIPGPGHGDITIRYNANGGNGAPSSHTVTKDRNGIARFSLSLAIPTRNGYDFLGWLLENDSVNAIVSPGQSITINNSGGRTGIISQTYYAQWKDSRTESEYGNVTIKYNSNGGSWGPDSHTVKKDRNGVARFNLSSAQARRPGYRFAGWLLENSSANPIVSLGQSITISLGSSTGDITLTYYAQWEATEETTRREEIFTTEEIPTTEELFTTEEILEIEERHETEERPIPNIEKRPETEERPIPNADESPSETESPRPQRIRDRN